MSAEVLSDENHRVVFYVLFILLLCVCMYKYILFLFLLLSLIQCSQNKQHSPAYSLNSQPAKKCHLLPKASQRCSDSYLRGGWKHTCELSATPALLHCSSQLMPNHQTGEKGNQKAGCWPELLWEARRGCQGTCPSLK